MSGFEVVGVVLGAIPLVLSALETYKKTSRRLKYFPQKEILVSQLISSLEEQRLFVKNDVISILKHTTLERSEIEALLDKTDCQFEQILTSAQLELEIKEFLGDGHTPYITALVRAEAILLGIAKRISGLLSRDQASVSSLSSLIATNPPRNGLYQFSRRIKFTLTKEDLDAQIRQLNDVTSTLERITRSIDSRNEVTFTLPSRTTTNLTKSFDQVATYAGRLHASIAMAYSKEPCRPGHEAQLFLEQRTERMKNKSTHPKSSVSFTIFFGTATPGTCLQAVVNVLEDQLTMCRTNDAGKNKPGSQSGSVSAPSFGTMCQFPVPSQGAIPQLEFIVDICKQCPGLSPCELYLSHDDRLCRDSSLNRGDKMTISNLAQFGPLDRHLRQGILPLKQRLRIALTVVSSVMQLSVTPWLENNLTAETLLLASRLDNASKAATTAETFISRRFLSTGIQNKAVSVKRMTLEAGILLLELWLEKTLVSFAEDAQIALTETFGSRYDAAHQWAKESAEHCITSYHEAAKRCIECSFATTPGMSTDFDWRDEIFRNSFCGYVVRPLMDSCRAYH